LTVLALATLGGTTQIGLFLFLVVLPKVAKAITVLCCCPLHYRTYFAYGNTTL
jgi:hypothetical protein